MQFMVDIIPSFPHDWTQTKVTEMLAAETAAAIELMEKGVLLRIDRVVGHGGNMDIGICWSIAEVE